MRVAVIGAGWAGLAAASELSHRGYTVDLFESAHTVGGRARRVDGAMLGTVDNGQHLLIGAYTQTLKLIERDVPEAQRAESFCRRPLSLTSVSGCFEMKADPRYPRPIRMGMALWTAKGLSWQDKWQATRFFWRLKRCSNTPPCDQTVSEWLTQEGQTQTLTQWLWYPLCLASMNTRPDQASAELFYRVIRESLMAPDVRATDLLLPATDLTTLWPLHVARRVHSHLGHTVRTVEPSESSVMVDGELFDGAILATPAWSLPRLLHGPAADRLAETIQAAQALTHLPIATCYVELQSPWQLPIPMMMLNQTSDATALGQWVFDHQFIRRCHHPTLAFVLSDATAVLDIPDKTLGEHLMVQLTHEVSQRAGKSVRLPNIQNVLCIREKRATFAALPSLKRPSQETVWPRLTIAGDWTDTGYPAVLEGAVRSGVTAATVLDNRLGKP